MELIYGIHAVEALLRSRPDSIAQLCCQSGRDDRRMALVTQLADQNDITVQWLVRKKLDDMVEGRHQGVVAEVVGKQNGWSEEQLFHHLKTLDRPPLLLILDGVTDPHNLGACLRSADAAGVNALIVPKDKSADLNSSVRKVACGAAESVPFVRVSNLARTLEKLKEQGIWLFGTAGEAEQSVFEVDFKGPMALIMGAEGKGMRRLTRESCDYLLNLPMSGAVSSLNVSVATGICLFEAVRQRR